MKRTTMLVLVATLLAVCGCVVEPYGGGRGYYHSDHDYGRRVWRE